MGLEPIVTTVDGVPPPAQQPRSVWLNWLRKATLSVTDQGLVSGSNFLLNILLARWMSREQYGAYALGYSIFLLMTAMYQSLVLEPMSVLGPTLYADRPKRYLGALLRGQSLLLLGIAAALGAGAVAAAYTGGKEALGHALAGLAIAAPAILLFWLARAACYLHANLSPVIRGAALYSVLLTGGIALVRRFWILNEFTAFFVIGAASAGVGAHLLRALKPDWRSRDDPRAAEVWGEHWRFGRWELARAGFDWTGENISYALTAAFLGMRQVGELKAIMNLFLPLSHVYTALRRLFLPHLASVSSAQGVAAARASVMKLNLLTCAMNVSVWLTLELFGRTIFRALYGGRFAEVGYLVPYAALALVASAPINGFDMGLRAVRSPALVFTASATSASVSTVLYVVGTSQFGLPGTIGADIGANVVYTSVIAFLYYRRARRP